MGQSTKCNHDRCYEFSVAVGTTCVTNEDGYGYIDKANDILEHRCYSLRSAAGEAVCGGLPSQSRELKDQSQSEGYNKAWKEGEGGETPD
jgi:hypothetical protein